MWIECNALRRGAVFLRQTFSDPISLASLSESNQDHSKLARNLFPIDIMQAKGLRTHTQGRMQNIKDCLFMYVEREALKQQGLSTEAIDECIFRGLLSREKVAKFWASVVDMVLERVSRKALKKRPFVKVEDIKVFA